MVKDLDKAAENYKRLGFTVSPRGTHSAHMGSGNYTIMFDPDYMELLGVLTPTEHNAPARAFLEKRGEGIERIAFTAVDSAEGAEEIRARGYPPVGLPERGGAGLMIAADLAATEKALGPTGVRSGGGIVVPPAAGNGTLLAFVKE